MIFFYKLSKLYIKTGKQIGILLVKSEQTSKGVTEIVHQQRYIFIFYGCEMKLVPVWRF